MSKELDKAREQLEAGRYKRAADMLWEAERWAQTDAAEAQGLVDVASALVARTTGRIRQDAEALVRDGQKYLKSLAESDWIVLGLGRYLGGCRAMGDPCEGRLAFARDGVHLDSLLLDIAAIASVALSSERTSKTNVGAIIAFGVVGLAMQDTGYRSAMVVHLKSSESASFIIEGAFDARARLAPLLQELGIPVGDASDLLRIPPPPGRVPG